ncbi:hypothetical protein J8I26_06285 [Herbaspirillum sp. LeCh32-8]|uniref:hypothetical protein n=1 Tax=Herbaspirillum sp. LeCh32-8 TaxID=2821356 RepID=UPI001AE7BD49|nr:hypothetical protein [Herbaspirillum sp. LeCh32-8]MBP0597702.1 hypothetical protein [Herbaspirillum sp. LeCh32-8]
MIDWIPVIFVTFKVIVLCTGMFFAVKWHYDQGKKGKVQERRAVLRASVKVAVIFILLLLGLGLVTYDLAKMFGLDLTFP